MTPHTSTLESPSTTGPGEPESHNNIYAVLDIAINCYIIQTVSLLGIIGNVFNIVVLCKHGMQDSTTILLSSLSIVDLLYVVTTSLRRIYCLFVHVDPPVATTLMAVERAFLSVANRITGIISAGHIVLISLERTVAVYFPFSVSRIFSVSLTKAYLAIIYVFFIVLSSPYLYAYDFYWEYDDTVNTTVGRVRLSKFFADNFEIFQWINAMIVSNVRGPVFIIIVLACSILIWIRLYMASIKRAKISTNKSGVDLKVVRMLLVVSVVYLCIGIPVHIPYMYFYFNPQGRMQGSELSPLYLLLTEHASDLFYTINASVNFIIYVTMSQKFLKTWKIVVKCKS